MKIVNSRATAFTLNGTRYLSTGGKVLRGAIKFAGIATVAITFAMDVHDDFTKYDDGEDTVKAVGITVATTALTIAAGFACTGVGAPIGVAIGIGVVAGVGFGYLGSWLKYKMIN